MKIEKGNTPLVSIILSVYNRNNTLERAIKSVLEQTFKSYELIIIDDGSTDNVEEMLFPYLKRNKNFKYLRHSNRSFSLSRNTGILIAQGEYVTFIDSDDEYKKEHLERMISFMNDHPNMDLIHSSPEVIGNEADLWIVNAIEPNELIHIKDCVIGATFFGKKEVFIELEGFKDLSYAEDFDFFTRLVSQKKFKTQKVEEKTYIYHKDTKDSVSNKEKQSYLIKSKQFL